MYSITLRKPDGPIKAVVELPRSKSVASRAALIASMARPPGPQRLGATAPDVLLYYSDADDSVTLLNLLKERPPVMHCGMGGTTLRFLLAWAAIRDGEEHLITGDARLLERPHDALVTALRSLGADIESVTEGFRVRGRTLPGGEVELDSPVSSQFITALMMIAPMMENGLVIRWRGRKLSEPYVLMTAKVMAHFGAQFTIHFHPEVRIEIDHSGYAAHPITIPMDWSAAPFFYQVAALSPGASISFPHLLFDDFQGDQAIRQLLGEEVETTTYSEASLGRQTIGVRIARRTLRRLRDHGNVFHLSEYPDLFPALAITMAALGREARFTGLDNLALKESDRLTAVADVLKELGIPHTVGPGSLELSSAKSLIDQLAHRSFTFDPRGDHRMAMAMAPLALVCESITITDLDVVNKSYPGYWEQLAKVGFRVDRA